LKGYELRDFNSGDIHVNGNFIISDQSQQGKPFEQCTIEELRYDRAHRQNLLEQEQIGKIIRVLMVFVLIAIGVAAWWLGAWWLEGSTKLVEFVAALLTVFGFLGFGHVINTPTPYEKWQTNTIDRIDFELRDRGV
jgi:hypothetical protein